MEMIPTVESADLDCDITTWNKNIFIMSPKKELPDIMIGSDSTVKYDNPKVSHTPDIVNYDNLPIFLNAVAGLFLPICHYQGRKDSNSYQDELSKMLSWQQKFFRVQIIILNSMILIVIGVIYILVTSIETFNYNFNLLNLFRFNIATLFLLSMGILTIAFTFDLNLSFSSNFLQRKIKKCGQEDLCKNTYFCVLATLIVFLPIICCVVLFNYTGRPQTVLFFVNDNQENQEVVMIGTEVVSPFYHKRFDTIKGQLNTDCHILRPSNQNILSINLTDPTCLGLLEDKKMITLLQNMNLTAVLILDNTPSVSWRVSSPNKPMDTFMNHWRQSDSTTLPVILLVRSLDWGKFSQHFSSGKKLWVSQDKNIDLEKVDMFSCHLQKEIKVRVDQGKNMTSGISGDNEVTIMTNGNIVKEAQISVTCSFNGEDCNWDVRPFKRIHIECNNISNVIPSFYITSKNTSLQPAPIQLKNRMISTTCCKDSKTFLRILSSEKYLRRIYRLSKETLGQCTFSNVIEESCDRNLELIHRSKYCVKDTRIIHEYTKVACHSKNKMFNKCDIHFLCT